MIFLVHSMGKCGSRSIYYALFRAGYRAYHCHYLDELPKELREAIASRKVYIISPIRRPVFRNISAYFQNLYNGGRVSMDEFLKEYPHDVPLKWFDREFKPHWGIDVYSEPFDLERGWQVYNGRALIIRAMDLDREWANAFQALTGRNAPKLVRENVTRKAEYKRFLREEEISPDYIKQMRHSKYYRHFYGIERI